MSSPTLLILGARSDIARAIAREYARHGYKLQLAARNAPNLETDAEDLRIRHGIDVTLHEWDAQDTDNAANFYARLPIKPDCVACVAGYLGKQERGEQDWKECESILRVNFTGLVAVLNEAAQDMASRGSGRIIGVSSVAGDRGRQSNYLYGSAKAGFTAYLSGLRNRLHKHGVQVLTVKPGFVATRMTETMDLPAVLTTTPEKLAAAVYRAQARGRNSIYAGWYWRWIMLIIRHLPEALFKRLSL